MAGKPMDAIAVTFSTNVSTCSINFTGGVANYLAAVSAAIAEQYKCPHVGASRGTISSFTSIDGLAYL